ncbi:DUF799 domain-containing protein [Halosquirtibacter xylanolyticus]|uniref:GNA1162 family protein n=1 Tax=Halosquirtibacter xylanolyticus TaxID=3374599 RepID=UPI003748BA11|nr:DUF799 domain-containing protein [Prolixibacteraceae bacterium]
MMQTRCFILVVLATIMFYSCAPTNQLGLTRESYEDFYSEHPTSIMIMPPINKSMKVEAKLFFYNTLVQPIVEKGYYIVPFYMGLDILKNESAYDSELLYDKSMKVVKQTWGIDAVLFTTIYEWKKVGTGQVVVDIGYELRSTESDKILYDKRGDVTVNMTSNSGNYFVDLAAIALKTAFAREINVAKSCNKVGLEDMPYGSHNKLYMQDKTKSIGEKNFSVVVSQ